AYQPPHSFPTRRSSDLLFFGTLNTPARQRSSMAVRFGSIPFLNGGLFSRAPVERVTRGLAFSDDAYGSLIYDLFGQYRFTAAERSEEHTSELQSPYDLV